MSLHGYSNDEYDDGSNVDNVTLISKLDVSHPLHLHPNDSVALTVVSVKLKGTENYQVWSCAMLLALEGLDDTYMQIRSSILSRETLLDVRSAYAIGLLLVVCLEPLKGLRLLLLMSMLLTKGTFRGHKPLLVSQGLLMIIDLMIMGIGELLGFYFDLKAGSNLKGKNVSNNAIGSNSSNGFYDEQMATFISLIKENSVNVKGIHANMAGTYMNSSTMFNKNFEKFSCSNSSMISKLVSKGLITDSGANQHITYTDKNLTNVIDVSYLKIKVTQPNGIEAFITKIGNMMLTNYLTLYDVLIVSEYYVSLMSVHKVDRDSKLVISFDEMHCYVMNQDLGEGKILGTGKQIDGLYYFDGNQGIEFGNFKSNNVCFLSKQTWHCRLGHPTDQVLDCR
ncbi:hypothetical protein Tco_1495741 [Tanacetum coccineum]